MTALAQLSDIPGSADFDRAHTDTATAALDTASAVVRAYCRQQFTAQSHTTRLRARGNWLVLPQRPVASVQAVRIMVMGAPTATTGWIWDGLDRVWIGNFGVIINLSEALLDAVQASVVVAEVDYTAGYVTIPADVVVVVAQLTARALAVPAGGVYSSQTVGPFAATVASWAQGGPLALTDSDKVVLNQYRRGGSTVELRS